jgi:uncharacterized protein YjeT (DUF2065 family)
MLLTAWLRRIWLWLAEVPTFWSFLLVLFVLVALPVAVASTAEDALRYAGLLLQLVGVSVVAYTLRGRGKVFNHKPVFEFALDWLKRAPPLRPHTRVIEASAIASANAFATADATVWRGPRLDQSIEVQLEVIRENLVTVREQVANLSMQTGRQVAELRTALESERSERAIQLQETRRTLQQVAAESLYLEVAGLCWLVAGIILATVPKELVAAMRLLAQ